MTGFDEVNDLLDYDPHTGSLVWKKDGFRRVAGQSAGVVRSGYRWVTINGQEYMGGRIAWLLTHGVWPETRVRFHGASDDLRLGNLYVDAFKWQTKEAKNQKSRERRIADPSYFKHHELKKDFGISLERYTEMLTAQKGVCAICEQPETAIRLGKIKMLAVDHHHGDVVVRGLLCSDCNLGIGKLGDSPDRLRAAAAYLERHAMKKKAAA